MQILAGLDIILYPWSIHISDTQLIITIVLLQDLVSVSCGPECLQWSSGLSFLGIQYTGSTGVLGLVNR